MDASSPPHHDRVRLRTALACFFAGTLLSLPLVHLREAHKVPALLPDAAGPYFSCIVFISFFGLPIVAVMTLTTKRPPHQRIGISVLVCVILVLITALFPNL